MHIHALCTGTVMLKYAFLFPGAGVRRQLNLLLPGPFSGPMPIHAWVIDHDGRRILVDTGEVASALDPPFARFDVSPQDELPGALAGVGLTVEDLDTIVLTHAHGDHVDGAVHLGGRPVLTTTEELAWLRSLPARAGRTLLRQPLPRGVALTALPLDDGPFGAFAASAALTDDGRVRAVATPGHTPGHISILCLDDAGRHVLLAGDASDSLEQLRAQRVDAVSPDPAVMRDTLARLLAHAREHPVVYLPSHDPESAQRLARGEVIEA